MSIESISFLLQSHIVNEFSDYMNTTPNSINNTTISPTINNTTISPTTNNTLGNNKLFYLLISSILIQ